MRQKYELIALQSQTPIAEFQQNRDEVSIGDDVHEEVHRTAHLQEAKHEAKARGRAGRFRGKTKARQNNKARGGKMAR